MQTETQFNKNRFPMSGRVLKCMAFILALISIAYVVIVQIYRVTWQDECYMAFNVENYLTSPLAFLTFYIGSIWCRLFSETILSFRILMIICYMLSFMVGCWYLYRKTGEVVSSLLVFSVQMFSFPHFMMDIYGWDAGVYPFVMFTLMASLNYLRRKTIQRVMVLAIISGLLVASRITMIVVIPAVLCLIVYISVGKRDIMLQGVLYLVFSCLSFLLCVLLAYGGIEQFIRAYSPENIITGHGFGMLVSVLKTNNWYLGFVMISVVVSAVMMLSSYLVVEAKRRRWLWLVGIVVVIYYAQKPYCTGDDWFNQIWLFPTLVALFYPQLIESFRDKLKRGDKHNDKESMLSRLMVLFFMLVPMVGSDYFVARPIPLLIFPVALAFSYPYLKRYLIPFLFFMLLPIIQWSKINDYDNMTEYNVSGEQISPMLKGLRVNQKNIEVFEYISGFFKKNADDGVSGSVVGGYQYESHYLFEKESLLSLPHFHYIKFDEENPEFLDKMASRDRLLVFNPLYVDDESEREFKEFLRERGFKVTGESQDGKLVEYSRR